MSFRYPFILIVTLLTILPQEIEARKRHRKAPISITAIEPDRLCAKAIQEKRVIKASPVTVVHHQSFINSRFREGIDVSHYQGKIDWDKVAKSTSISYAYMKATEGATYVDDTYRYNLSEARRVGLSVGSYHFYRPTVTPQQQLENMRQNIKANEQDLVPIIDIEHRGKVSEEKFIKDLTTFIGLVENYYGKKPLLYSYQNFYNRHLCGLFRNYHWMIAKYQDERPILTDNHDYIMWQYTSTGSIPGIRGDVDRSRLMGNHSLKQLQL